MKKILAGLLSIVLIFSSCNDTIKSEDVREITDQDSSILSMSAMDDGDIYANQTYHDPIANVFNTSVMVDDERVYYRSLRPIRTIYFSDNHTNESHTLCMEPTCSHNTEGCIAAGLSGNMYNISNTICYYTRDKNLSNRTQIYTIDVDHLEKKAIYSTSNYLLKIFGIGKYLFAIEEVKTGKYRNVRINLDTLDAVEVACPNPADLNVVYPHDGRIYYRTSNNELWSADTTFTDIQRVIDDTYILYYEFHDEYIYYTTTEAPSNYVFKGITDNPIYTLKRYNTTTKEIETVMNDVHYFCINNAYIFYSKNNPVNGGEFTVTYDDNGEIKNKVSQIKVLNGNKIYVSEINNIGTISCELIPPDGYVFDNHYFSVGDYFYITLKQVRKDAEDGSLDILEELGRTSFLEKGEWQFLTNDTDWSRYE